MSQRRIPRPDRAEGTVLAALLVLLLAAMLLVQLVLPQERPLQPNVPRAAMRAGPMQIAAVSADPALARRSIFQPTPLANPDGAGVPTGPLGGAVPAGIVRVRGAARLLLQTPDGTSVTLRPGQSWQGWQLTRIGSDDVSFRRGGESVTLGLGAAGNFSGPGFDPSTYDPRGFDGGFQPNQADEQ